MKVTTLQILLCAAICCLCSEAFSLQQNEFKAADDVPGDKRVSKEADLRATQWKRKKPRWIAVNHCLRKMRNAGFVKGLRKLGLRAWVSIVSTRKMRELRRRRFIVKPNPRGYYWSRRHRSSMKKLCTPVLDNVAHIPMSESQNLVLTTQSASRCANDECIFTVSKGPLGKCYLESFPLTVPVLDANCSQISQTTHQIPYTCCCKTSLDWLIRP